MKLSLISFILSLTTLSLCYCTIPNKQLHFAIQFGKLQEAQTALQNGASISTIDSCGYVPLHHAAYYGNSEIIKLLLTHGAHNTINTQSVQTGSTPLYYAVYCNHVKIVKLLVDAGASITLKNNAHISALDLAIHNNKQEIRHILEEYLVLKKEAQENPTKATLRKAIQANYPNLVILMLNNNVSADIADINELQLAKILGHQEIEQVLTNYLINVNQTEKK